MNSKDSVLARRVGLATRRRRNELGWSQAVLAEHIDASVEYVSMIERGTRVPSVPTLVALASALGLSTDELLGLGKNGERSEDVIVMLAKAIPDGARRYVTKMLAALGEPNLEAASRGTAKSSATDRTVSVSEKHTSRKTKRPRR